jgi:hypothetical protein
MEKEVFAKVTLTKTDYGVGSPRSSSKHLIFVLLYIFNLFFAVAIVNAFKNRKVESAFLKNTFPAGFGSDTNSKSTSL